MLWQGRCVDALPCNYNEIRVQRVAAWQILQLQCCSCNWQLAQFQLLQRGASFVLFCSVLFCSSPSFFLPPAACSAVLSFVCCCCPSATTAVIFRLRLVQLQLATTIIVSCCLGQNWPCGPRRCFLAQLGKYFKQSK